MGKGLQRYMDGEIVFAFNAFRIDAELVKSDKGGQYIKKANYTYIKRRGKKALSQAELSNDIKAKIRQYTPKGINW